MTRGRLYGSKFHEYRHRPEEYGRKKERIPVGDVEKFYFERGTIKTVSNFDSIVDRN